MANTSPRHMSVLGYVHPIKIENIFFRDINCFIFLIDRATQDVPMKGIWKKLSDQFFKYTPLHC